MAYKRKTLIAAARRAGLRVRRNGDMLLFFVRSDRALFMVRDCCVYDHKGMCFNTDSVPDASNEEAAKFPNDGTND